MDVNDASLRKRAADLGAAIRAEDGVGAAVSFLQRQSGGPLRPE